jgi:hypothetical protein
LYLERAADRLRPLAHAPKTDAAAVQPSAAPGLESNSIIAHDQFELISLAGQ